MSAPAPVYQPTVQALLVADVVQFTTALTLKIVAARQRQLAVDLNRRGDQLMAAAMLHSTDGQQG